MPKQNEKRPKAGTAAAKLAAFSDAAGIIPPPPHVQLRDGDIPFWQSIAKMRPKASWTHHDLEMAAELARCKYDIELLRQRLEIEGETVLNQHGVPIVNPVSTQIDRLVKRAISLARVIHVHAEATEGSSHWQRKKSQDLREAQALTAELGASDGLIPTMATKLRRCK